TRAGPDGKREFLTAMAPSGRRATSTRARLGLLCLLFSQVTSGSSAAGMPLYVWFMFPPVTASKVCYWRAFELAEPPEGAPSLTLTTEYATFEPRNERAFRFA